MVRLLLILLLFSLSAKAQSGRYNIESVNGETKEGFITLSPYSIIINQDSTILILPVTDVGTDKRSTYYVIEGCQNGKSYRGYALHTNNSRMSGRQYSTLFIEVRSRQNYASSKYNLYHNL